MSSTDRVSRQALKLSTNGHGKPRLESSAGLHFSVAHTPGAIVCAVTADGDVGVDIELRARAQSMSASSVERLAKRYFSAEEHGELCALQDEASKRARFVELWTLKEAYVKALGRGIAAAPLSGFSMTLSPPSAPDASVRRIHLTHGASSRFAPELYTRAPDTMPPLAGGTAQRTALCGWHFWLLQLGASADDHVAAVCAPCATPDTGPVLRCWRTLPTVRDVAVALDDATLLAQGRAAAACASA